MQRILLSLLIILLCSGEILAKFQPVHAKKAMVATADIYATEAGLQILRDGGNAVDASVTVAFVLAVTYPQAGNIGGGGFMLFRNAENECFTLDYREKAPQSASRDMYLDQDGNVIANASLIGYKASGVPGTVDGTWRMHQRFGSLSWEKLIEPAIALAQNGYKLDRFHVNSLNESFEYLAKYESTRAIFAPGEEKFSEGTLFVQPELAATLKRISQHGRDDFYKGETAGLIAGDMKLNDGLITLSDLDAYESVWREPISFSYRDYKIYSMGPPSSGGIILAEILNTLENYDLNKIGLQGSNLIHIWAEAERQAYADRARYLGDSDYFDVPVDQLISKHYATKLFSKINPFQAAKSDGNSYPVTEHSQTTHFSIVDKWGNAVSNTYTLNNSYGSCVMISGAGFLMNNEMDDFSIKPGHANLFGLTGSIANEIVPGKRMLSSMTPTIVTKNDSLYLVLGSPGGSTIITTVAQVISNCIDHKMNIRDAIESPRFHHQWLPDEIRYEQNRYPRDVLEKLTALGHNLQPGGNIGDVQAILFDDHLMEWTGWSDPRGNGITQGIQE